jgi:hypothetical protein
VVKPKFAVKADSLPLSRRLLRVVEKVKRFFR